MQKDVLGVLPLHYGAEVETRGVEPLTDCVQSSCSPN
jgi:hypothetical protein